MFGQGQLCPLVSLLYGQLTNPDESDAIATRIGKGQKYEYIIRTERVHGTNIHMLIVKSCKVMQ